MFSTHRDEMKLLPRNNSTRKVARWGNGHYYHIRELHVIVDGNHSDDHKHRGNLSQTGHLEVYDEGRYFVLTGDVYDGLTSVKSRPTVVREVQDDYLPRTSEVHLHESADACEQTGVRRRADGCDSRADPANHRGICQDQQPRR